MTAGRSLDYDALTQDALRGVVRTVLTQVAKSGLPGEHHFYIAFDTQAPGVVLSRRLREKYPEEMMIVLQHRFWDLAVTDDGFEVKLTFDGIPERLAVPFSAVKVFFDPSVRFTLQFSELTAGDDQQDGTGARRRRDGADADAGRNGQRPGGDRRPKPRPALRPQKVDGTEAPGPAPVPQQPPAPAAFIPRPVDSGAKPAPAPAPVAARPAKPAEEEQAPAAAPSGGAKVLSLDQFRKK